MAKFLPVWLPQPSLMLEKARGIHLWLLWIISSAQLCISTTPLPALPEDTSWTRNRDLPNSRAKLCPQAKLPCCLSKSQAGISEGKAWLGVCHWDKALPAWFWPHSLFQLTSSLPAASRQDTAPGWEEKVPSNFSAQPVFCSTWKNHCSSSGMHTNDKYALEAIN